MRCYLAANVIARDLAAVASCGMEPDFLQFDLASLRSAAPDATQWRVLDHCAAVGRIYALFEQFCEALLAEWIAFRTDGVQFSELPDKMRVSYAEQFPSMLSDTFKVRYAHIVASDMIGDYHHALSGGRNFKLTPEVLTRHNANLRWLDVVEIFNRSGLTGLDEWISQHPKLTLHFETKKRIVEQTTAKLAEFVQYRNDAAHGAVVVDEILGSEDLLDRANFIRALCGAIDQLVLKESLAYLLETGHLAQIGSVTEVFSNNVVVCILEGARIERGSKLFLATERTCDEFTVASLMLENVDVEEAVLAKPREVGIKFAEKPPAGAKVYLRAKA